MSPLDLLILAALASAVVGGYRLGFLARLTSWAGLGLGVFLGAIFLPEVATYFGDAEPGVRALAAVAFLLAAGMLGQGVGLAIGAALHATLRIGPGLRRYDRMAGGFVGATGIIVIFWLLIPSLAQVQGLAAQWTRSSAVVQVIATVFPDPPDTFQRLSRLLGDGGFPPVFEGLDRNPDAGPPPADSPLSPEVRAAVIASTVKIQGQACRRIQEGSGFSVGADLVVTNAHVVAGEDETEVQAPDGRRLSATVIHFDPDRDLALLNVPGLGQAPLALSRAEEGDVGSVFGHPGGGPLEESPAHVTQRVDAVGRDIYDRNRTRRNVFILAAGLRPGDSGGALVNPAGEVVGVAFAIAPDRANTAYALTEVELEAVLGIADAEPADTGPCLV